MRRFTPQKTGFALYLLDVAGADKSATTRSQEAAVAEAARVPCAYWQMTEPHAHEDHEVIVVVAGTGRFHWGNGEETPVAAGQLLAIPAGLTHTYDTNEGILVKGFCIHPSVFHRIGGSYGWFSALPEIDRSQKRPPPRLLSDPHLFSVAEEMFEQAISEYADFGPLRLPALEALGRYSAILFVRVMTARQAPPGGVSMWQVRVVKAWLDRHYIEHISVESLARRANLSVSHFTARFRELTGLPPKAYTTRLRLAQATHILAETDVSVTEAASRVGFESPAQFSRTFRRHIGQSPAEYQRNAHAEPRKARDTQ